MSLYWGLRSSRVDPFAIFDLFVVQSLRTRPTLCNPMDYSTPSFPVLHYLLEFAQTHTHWAGDVGLCCVLGLSHSFKGGTLSPSPPVLLPGEGREVTWGVKDTTWRFSCFLGWFATAADFIFSQRISDANTDIPRVTGGKSACVLPTEGS